MRQEIRGAIIAVVVIAAGVGGLYGVFSTLDQVPSDPTLTAAPEGPRAPPVDKSGFKQAPGITGIAEYINTDEVGLAEAMEGKVVLYDIWTYSCINCIRTLPYITAWDEKYADQGLLIVGIHSPEFEFEKDPDNVRTAVAKYGIEYPVVMDNDMDTWKAFENRYWPRKYVADHEGFIRYDHIGEGAYDETERVIQNLLAERASALGMQEAAAEPLVDIAEFEHTRFRTPELYLGYHLAFGRSQIGNPEGFQREQVVEYAEPASTDLHKFYMVGTWRSGAEGMELVSETGRILLPYVAKEVNIVAANAADLVLRVDGDVIPPGIAGPQVGPGGALRVSESDLYNLVSEEAATERFLEIEVSGPGFQIFTFTFG